MNKILDTLRAFYRRDYYPGVRGGRLSLVVIVLAVVAGFATWGALSASPPFGDDPETVIWLLNIDLIILLMLVILIARRAVGLWSGRKRGVAASRLHVRLVFIFSLLAAAPAVIMTVFSAFFLHFGVQSWFGERVRTALGESQAVAEAYLEEHTQVIRADTRAMAQDLERQASLLLTSPEAFQKIMETQSFLRNLSEAAVFDGNGRILARTGLTFALAFETLPPWAIAQADQGEAVVMTGEAEDRVRALVKLGGFWDAYLFAGRMVDPDVLSRVADTREVVQEYEELAGRRFGLQIAITMIYIVVALLLLLAAIWVGLIFARQLATPIGTLIATTERVRGGDLDARVPAFGRKDEFDLLGRAFNRMTGQIRTQQEELLTTNRALDERNRFTEAVLGGVSAGIIGLDKDGIVTIANTAASTLLGYDESASFIEKSIEDVLPETVELLETARTAKDGVTQAEIPTRRADGAQRTLLIRIAAERNGTAVLTFDDITALQAAQRKAAWSDVARRIAHEIKNPLTPIQLAADRLKRKYIGQIKEAPEIFSQCTDTIVDHAADIGRMVDEFSAFARMPDPVMAAANLSALVRDVVALEQQAHPDLEILLKGAKRKDVNTICDERQIRQALVNILHNAIDSVKGDDSKDGQITVSLSLSREDGEIILSVADNGPGLPEGLDPAHLMEPYVTHKEKGTGLGLAIVRKIMEDHDGRFTLEPLRKGGAKASLVWSA